MKLYKVFSLGAALIFAVVGLIFLIIPTGVLVFFNNLSLYLGLPPSPVQGVSFYLILAVAYMYLVTLLAFLMYRYPRDKVYVFLLANAKIASAALSLGLFVVSQPYLIFLANFVIDGSIGLLAIYFLKILKTWPN